MFVCSTPACQSFSYIDVTAEANIDYDFQSAIALGDQRVVTAGWKVLSTTDQSFGIFSFGPLRDRANTDSLIRLSLDRAAAKEQYLNALYQPSTRNSLPTNGAFPGAWDPGAGFGEIRNFSCFCFFLSFLFS